MRAGLGTLRELLKRDPRLTFRFDDKFKVFRFLRGNLATIPQKRVDDLRSSGLRFLKGHRNLFGKIDLKRTTILEETSDPNGGKSLTLQQYHGNYRVLGGSIRFHVNKDGILDSISNSLFPDLDSVSRTPRVNFEKAIKIAQKGTKCKTLPKTEPELLVFRHKDIPRLAWEVRLHDTKIGERGVPAQWIAYVDAVNGELFFYYDNIQTVGPIVGNGTGYYSGSGTLNAWDTGATFHLRDTTRTITGGPEIITNDEDGTSPSSDPDDNWNDSIASPRDQNQGPEVDAHRYAGNVVDYFQTVHGRNSFNGSGGNVIALVHLGTNYNNGYWDGTKINLGDGSGSSPGDDYETSDDWLAHELTHGYTEFTCGLQYYGESGALNEAFSDTFAAFITGDWLVFEDSWLKMSAPAWRNMMDPTNGGQWDNSSEANAQTSVIAGHCPSHYNNRYTGTWDNAGVHVNSGIINNLFYLLTVGGTHTISGISVSGIGQSSAEMMLFRCMAVKLMGEPTANFLDFRRAMLEAYQDLFPTDLFKLTQLKNAFNAVGIGPDIYLRDNLADTGQEPYPGLYLYASPDIINRTSPSSNPTTDFADLTNDALWQNVEYGQDNYVYIRIQNRGNQNGDATINVYFSAASTFAMPSSWIHIGTITETSISPGSLRIAGPLTFPSSLIPSPGHYCMIAVISDGLDPAPDHNLIASVPDFLNFVRNSNNIAYRNMDVVDLVPGRPGVIVAQVRGLSDMHERFDLHVNIGHFVPGAKILVRGPSRMLDGAIAHGLKLIAHENGQNLYEVFGRGELLGEAIFHIGKPQRVYYIPGFYNILIEKDFELTVQYVLPKENSLGEEYRVDPHKTYSISISQLWNNEVVGAVGQFLRPRKSRQMSKRLSFKGKRRT